MGGTTRVPSMCNNPPILLFSGFYLPFASACSLCEHISPREGWRKTLPRSLQQQLSEGKNKEEEEEGEEVEEKEEEEEEEEERVRERERERERD